MVARNQGRKLRDHISTANTKQRLWTLRVYPSDVFLPARLSLLKIPHLPWTAPPTRDQEFKYMSLCRRFYIQTIIEPKLGFLYLQLPASETLPCSSLYFWSTVVCLEHSRWSINLCGVNLDSAHPCQALPFPPVMWHHPSVQHRSFWNSLNTWNLWHYSFSN